MDVIGHAEARAAFLEALTRQRLHHAWLIVGPRGIGKRCFADWAAARLLAAGTDGTDAAALLAAGSHPDHRILEPPEEGKGSSTGSIIVEQVRAISDFLHSYPAIAGWRTLIVDAIDDMNPNAANAFLKELEEPRERTIFLLVSHAPARLLPTIRSRCRMLRLRPLSDADTGAVLAAQNPALDAAALAALVRIADGAPGTAGGFAEVDVAALDAELDRIARGDGALAFARNMQGKAAVPRLQAALGLVSRRLLAQARRQPEAPVFALYAEAQGLARDALPLAYDRVQVALALADIVARLGRIQENR